jgi:esterase/lipase superfamily enzyme
MQGTARGSPLFFFQLQYCKHDIFYYNDPFLYLNALLQGYYLQSRLFIISVSLCCGRADLHKRCQKKKKRLRRIAYFV